MEAKSSTMEYTFFLVSLADFTTGLSVAVYVLLILVLYHVLFLVVDVRKIARRIEGITEELESVLLKPISMIDKVLQWVTEFIEEKEKAKKGKRK